MRVWEQLKSRVGHYPVDFRLIGQGAVLIAIGLLAPILLSINDFSILPLLSESIATNGSGALLSASARLVIMNTIRAFPSYTGILFMVEGLGFFQMGRRVYIAVIPILLIPLIYESIKLVYGITYDLGATAIAMALAAFIVSRAREMARYTLHKAVVFWLLLFGVMWLDIVPQLSKFGVGRGEVSMDIKRIAAFIQADDVLDIVGISLFAIFVFNAFLVARLLGVYTREIKMVEQAWHLEHMANELQIKSLENRAFREMKSLVHDLRTPLTTIQGLVGVIGLTPDAKLRADYAKRISDAVDKMNCMIREMMESDNKQIISAAELVEHAVAHVPQLNDIPHYRLEIDECPPLISVNKIKMSRALINILENALEAIDSEIGAVTVNLTNHNGDAQIAIHDNGCGIASENAERIWDAGYSTRNSSGLGLPFASDVVAKNNGKIGIRSDIGVGTRVTILLPGANQSGQAN